jgi:hypothetical protein
MKSNKKPYNRKFNDYKEKNNEFMKFMKNKKINQKNLNTFNNRYNSKLRSKNSKMEKMPKDVMGKIFVNTPNSINFSKTSVHNNSLYKEITNENQKKIDYLIEDLLDQNNVTKETLIKNLKIITKDNGTNGWDEERINIFSWDLSKLNLTKLPESFINLKIGGDLYLSANNLESLPNSFGNIKLFGSLYLNNNKLEILPDSFRNLQVGKLYLHNNNLKTLFSKLFLLL